MSIKSISKYLIVMGVVLLLVAVGNFSSGNTAWASNSNQGCVPGTIPCPTPTPSPGGGGNNNAPSSHILGTVTDLSTNQPGAGITVQINDITITTDSNGQYSLSNVAAGVYVVSLVLPEEFTSAQEPLSVQVDGMNDVVVDLGYYSIPLNTAAITETMVSTTTELSAPQTLPETGETRGAVWFAIVGMALIFSGIAVRWSVVLH